MDLFSEKKMSDKKYDFLEDIFVSLSNKWYAKDRAIKLNDNVAEVRICSLPFLRNK